MGLKKIKPIHQKRKYIKKSFKEFDYDILLGKKKWDKESLRDNNGKFVSYTSKRYRSAGFVSGPIIAQKGIGFGKGHEDRFYKPD